MFSKNNSKEKIQELQEVNNANNIIGKGTTLEGTVTTSGNIRIEGKLIGAITSKAKLVLGNTAWVKGNIIAQNAEIGGEVQGTIEVGGLLVLKHTAIVQGDIITSKMVFEEGAKFNGKCKMGDSELSSRVKDVSGSWKQNGSAPLKQETTAIPVLQDAQAK
jgi:cytoskeletal protein CcmA (bactofilin family)